MVNESQTDLLEELARLRKDGQPWHAIGRALSDWASRLENSERRLREIWEGAEEKTRLSRVMLKRFFSAFQDIAAIAAERGVEAADLLPASFSAAEVGLRLYARDAEKGLHALRGLHDRTTSLSDVRAELDQIPSRHEAQLLRARHGQLVEFCEGALKAAAPDVFGQGVIVRRRPKVRYFHPIGFEFRDASSRLVGGADLIVSSPPSLPDPLATVGLSALLSQYFPKFWFVIGPEVAREIPVRAVEVLEVIAPRIGIIMVEHGRVRTLRSAKENEHGAARASEYRTLVETFGGRGRDDWKPPAH